MLYTNYYQGSSSSDFSQEECLPYKALRFQIKKVGFSDIDIGPGGRIFKPVK